MSKLSTLLFTLLVASVPLGVAAQYMILGLCSVGFIWLHVRQGAKFPNISDPAWKSSLASLGMAGCLLVANFFSTNPRVHHLVQGIGPFLALAICPFLWRSGDLDFHRIRRVFSIMCFVVGLIAISQWLFPWQVEGTKIIADAGRARGLYSHPLTFAYVGCLLYPLSLFELKENRRSLLHWLSFLGCLSLLIFSRSKTVQLVLAVLTVVVMMDFISKKWRILSFIVGSALLALALFTKNPWSQKYHDILENHPDRQSGYRDDRLAFWHAHYLMVKEKLLFGHGARLDAAYRTPYYEQIGESAMEKKYEAHNVFLQMATEIGLVGLCFFIWWCFELFRLCRCAKFIPGLVTLGAFFIASLTQNSFQDAEVRYVLLVGQCLLLSYLDRLSKTSSVT